MNSKIKNSKWDAPQAGGLLLARRRWSLRRAKAGNDYHRYYYLKDHLGNNRIVMNSSGAVVQLTNYYPSGTVMAENPVRGDQGSETTSTNALLSIKPINVGQNSYVAPRNATYVAPPMILKIPLRR